MGGTYKRFFINKVYCHTIFGEPGTFSFTPIARHGQIPNQQLITIPMRFTQQLGFSNWEEV